MKAKNWVYHVWYVLFVDDDDEIAQSKYFISIEDAKEEKTWLEDLGYEIIGIASSWI